MVLSIVVISLITMTMIAGFAVLLAYNQSLILESTGGGRIRSFYRSQAGLVDALWRIRNNKTVTPGDSPNTPSQFDNPLFDPPPYGLDIDGNSPVVVDVTDLNSDAAVDISCVVGPGCNCTAVGPGCAAVGDPLPGIAGLRNIDAKGKSGS